jgi:L-asparaginase
LQDPLALQSALPLLNQYAHVEMDHLFNMPSPHITPFHMFQIAERVKNHLDRGADGVVVTHGTDTLEETAYFLHLVLDHERPVIVTGAMRSSNELGADGPVNMVNSVRVAAHEQAQGRGVLVVFNDEIHTARDVTKTHTSNVATFQSPGLGPVGLVTKKEIRFLRDSVKEPRFSFKPPEHEVALIKVVAGLDDSLITWAMDRRIGGIVLEGLGQGNVPPAMLPGLKKALAKPIPVVLVSRCFNGFVQDTYEYEGGGKQLKELSLIFSNGINGQKARIKLMLALSMTQDATELQNYFQF